MLCRGRALNFASGFQGVENSHYPRQGGSEGETQGALLSPCQQSMMKFYGKGAAADREATSTVQYRDRRPRSSLAGCSSCRAFVLQCNTRRSCPSRHTAAPAASCPSRRRHHRQGHRDRRTRSSPPTSEPPPPRRSNEQNSTVRPRLASSRTPLNAIRAAAGTPTFPPSHRRRNRRSTRGRGHRCRSKPAVPADLGPASPPAPAPPAVRDANAKLAAAPAHVQAAPPPMPAWIPPAWSPATSCHHTFLVSPGGHHQPMLDITPRARAQLPAWV